MPSPTLGLRAKSDVWLCGCVAAYIPCSARHPKHVARPQLLRPAQRVSASGPAPVAVRGWRGSCAPCGCSAACTCVRHECQPGRACSPEVKPCTHFGPRSKPGICPAPWRCSPRMSFSGARSCSRLTTAGRPSRRSWQVSYASSRTSATSARSARPGARPRAAVRGARRESPPGGMRLLAYRRRRLDRRVCRDGQAAVRGSSPGGGDESATGRSGGGAPRLTTPRDFMDAPSRHSCGAPIPF